MKYYKVNVTMKNGFKYSYTCIGRMLEGMKNASQSYWTENIEVVEITKEEHFKAREVTFEREPRKPEKVIPMSEPPKKKSVEKKTAKLPKMASLENFFESSEVAPENKKSKKRV